MSKEQVNHPQHYNLPGKKEAIDEIADVLGDAGAIYFCLGNAMKYNYRAGEKENNPKEQDESKIQWYLDWADRRILTEMMPEGNEKILKKAIEEVKNIVKKEA